MAGGGVIAKAIYNEVSFELKGLTMTLFYFVSVSVLLLVLISESFMIAHSHS